MRWYGEVLGSADWRGSLAISVEIAAMTTAVCTIVGTMLAVGLVRGPQRLVQMTYAGIVLRLISPETATAVASLLLFTQLGMALSTTTIVLGHIAVGLPYVTVLVWSRLASVDPAVEDSAMDLGATPLQALRLGVLPLLWPSIAAASMLCFVLSFDDFITTLFTSGLGVPPLPMRIYSMLRFGVTPAVNAIGVLMVAIALTGIAGTFLMLRLIRRRTPVIPGAAVLAPDA
jgi:ABC-type spermidine/putrescine transport system permease subunit II